MMQTVRTAFSSSNHFFTLQYTLTLVFSSTYLQLSIDNTIILGFMLQISIEVNKTAAYEDILSIGTSYHNLARSTE